MVYLSKKDADTIIRGLSNISNKEVKCMLKRIKSQEKRVYAKGKPEIRRLLQRAFAEKRRVKIRYYSPHSDEHTTRIIDIYKMHINSIIAYCHLREEERTFAIERINSAAVLN